MGEITYRMDKELILEEVKELYLDAGCVNTELKSL